ncbi:interferon alpha/beta receptor 1 [Microcaecilia unicolor]|uniref:Interferon alpha/beta receptor 1 n=1 Tax=Microcaecilia unicolor TaxID=1415580 RepID=A0A6P7Y5I7_9AMPH|nr:interferon alpha/beta receptor 1 [Microcaecilia unicolor]
MSAAAGWIGACFPSLLFLSLCARAWTDQGNPARPKNVQVHVVNSNFTLKWDWDGKCNVKDCNLTFSAYYHLVKRKPSRDWQKLSGCLRVSATICDFSLAKLDFLKKYKVRVKAEEGERSSEWSSAIKFVLYEIAEIGPPEVQVKAEYKLIRINISAPGSSDKTQMWDASDFNYRVEFWKNNSTEQQLKLADFAERIDNLEPNTTYCLKIKALLYTGEKESAFSPTYCVHTESEDANKVPRPENVRVHALNRNYVLKWYWNETYGENVTFAVAFCRAFKKKYNRGCWDPVLGCEKVTITECDLSSNPEIVFEGMYEFRVRAINGKEESTWSKEIAFTPSRDTEIGPPSKVEVKLIDGSIHLEISHPEEDGNQSMKDFLGFTDLSYRVFTWKNSTNAWEKRFEEERTQFTIPKLELDPETLYCLKVQAFLPTANKSGNFSPTECIKTGAGELSAGLAAAAAFFSIVITFLLLAGICYGVHCLYRRIKYVFFPSCKLPSNIEECFHEVSLKNSFIAYAAEPTENCSITLNIVTENTDETDVKDYTKHCIQSSVDSGNYSNEDDVNEGPSEKT